MESGLRNKAAVLMAVLMLAAPAMGCTTAKQKKPLPAPRKISEPSISLYVNETGQVKRLKMEEYITGVVAAEMEPDWPVKALAAQAILARTFTLKKIKDNGGVPKYKTDASTSVEEFQAYNPARINDNVRQAVNMTRGQVVKHRGKYINAWFSACDGGVEASAMEGLAFNKEKTPYIKAGAKDGCMAVTLPENKSWTASFPVPVVQAAVRKAAGIETGPVNAGNVAVAQRGPSGRAERIKIGRATVGGAALRLALGSDKMRSIYLDNIAVSGNNVVMTGRGYGHGVGMCQWGARKMAGEGKTPAEIIKFFFRDVTIDTIWK